MLLPLRQGQKAICSMLRNRILLILCLLFAGLFQQDLHAQMFRSKNSGNWNQLTTWESSVLGIAWLDAVGIPNTGSGIITIRPGHTVVVTGNQGLNKLDLAGTLQVQSGSLTINDIILSPAQVTVQSGGHLQSWGSSDYTTEIKGNGTNKIKVENGGKVTVGTGSAINSATYSGFATTATNVWENNSKFEWNTSTALPISGSTFFPGIAAAVKPLLIISNTGGNISGAANTTINGMLEIESSFNMGGTGTKTIRDGITGAGTITIPSTSGNISFSGTAPVLGGRNLTIITDKSIAIAGGLTIPADSSVIIRTTAAVAFTGKGSNNLVVNGSLDMGTAGIENTAGAVTVNGTIKTAHANGLKGGTITGAGTLNLAMSSTVEYNAEANQLVTVSPYYNLYFSGSGIKSPVNTIEVSNLVKISSLAVVDAVNYNVGSAAAALTMDGGRLQVGQSGVQPLMAGTYTLSAGVVQFAKNGGSQQIRGGTGYTYNYIEVAGDAVSNAPGNDVYLNPSGIFTIKSTGRYYSATESIQGVTGIQAFVMEAGGTLMCANDEGFYGPASGSKTPAVRANIENISLAAGSTINYSKAGAQIITAGTAYQALTLSGSGDKTPVASAILQVRGNLTSQGTARFIHNNGTVEITGTTAQTYLAATPFTFNILSNKNPVNLVVDADLSIVEALQFTANAKLHLHNGNIHVKSTAAKTAAIGAVANSSSITYTGTSRFFLERYVATHSRWHLLSIPSSDAAQTFKSAWAEGQNAGVAGTAGLGTSITGPAGAPSFDFASPGYSVKYWDANLGSTGNYKYVLKKDTAIAHAGGYYVYIRGDRNATATAGFGPTTLRTSGRLFYNPTVPVSVGKFSSVGNPLPSAVNLKNLSYSGGSLSEGTMVYLWDPAISGTYNSGSYQTLTYNGNNFIITPGGGGSSPYPAGGSVYNLVQSGQAFFIKDPAITQIGFPESSKAAGTGFVGREEDPSPVQRFDISLFTHHNNQPTIIDGTAVEMAMSFSNSIDSIDAEKMDNSLESLSITRNNKKFVVERHAPVLANDTFFLKTERLKKRQYSFKLAFQQMNENLQEAWLVDKYNNNRVALQVTADNNYSFTVNDSAASASTGRFYIILKAQQVLPVRFISVEAKRNGEKKIQVSWQVANEVNVEKYLVERSYNGIDFDQAVKKTILGSDRYSWTDDNIYGQAVFYRIRAVDKNASFQYSKVVRVEAENSGKLFSISPNPVQDKTLHIYTKNNIQSGTLLQVSNSTGQLLYTQVLKGGSGGHYKVSLDNIVPGIYQVSLVEQEGTVHTEKISIL